MVEHKQQWMMQWLKRCFYRAVTEETNLSIMMVLLLALIT